ncbi:hypothetical protein C8J57DRAFT_1086503, partial [Mycena rebaudengoi]
MVVGGMTQYLATVQGMPQSVEVKLEKRIRKFLWAEKTSVTVNKETVYAPQDLGGKSLLDIVSRNEAIAIMWLKTYLSFGDERPQWCFAVDEMVALFPLAVDAEVVDEAMRTNPYLQRWGPRLKDERGTKGIGKDLKNMFNIGKLYGLSQDAMAVSREIQRDMPIWYHAHSNGSRGIFNRSEKVVACLKENHRIRTV